MRQKRWVKKGSPKSKGWRKTGKKRKNSTGRDKAGSYIIQNKKRKESMIVYRSQFRGDYLPQRYRAKFIREWRGTIAVGTIVNAGTYFTVDANCCLSPFNTSFTNGLGILSQFAGSVSNTGFTSTGYDRGFSTFTNIYSRALVYNSSLSIQLNHTNSGDSTVVVLAPVHGDNIATATTSMYNLAMQKFAKEKIIVQATPVKDRKLFSKVYIPELIGRYDRLEDYCTDPNNNFVTNAGTGSVPNAASQVHWVCGLATGDGVTANAGSVQITLMVSHDVEMYDLVNIA